jgi:hypothetical protein
MLSVRNVEVMKIMTMIVKMMNMKLVKIAKSASLLKKGSKTDLLRLEACMNQSLETTINLLKKYRKTRRSK